MDLLVDVHRALHQPLSTGHDVRYLGLEEAGQNGGEDGAHGVLTEIRQPDHMEVAHETRTNFIPASSWRCTGRGEDQVLHVLEEKLVRVVKALLVNDLQIIGNQG